MATFVKKKMSLGLNGLSAEQGVRWLGSGLAITPFLKEERIIPKKSALLNVDFGMRIAEFRECLELKANRTPKLLTSRWCAPVRSQAC